MSEEASFYCLAWAALCYGGGVLEDTNDWPIFRRDFGCAYPNALYYPCGDMDNDGDVDTVDWPVFRDNFGSPDVPNDCPMPCVWPPAQ